MEVLPCISDSLVYDDLLSLIQQHFPEAYDLWPRTYDEWYDLHKRELFEQRRLGRKAREIQVYPGLPPEDWKDHASDYYLSRLGLDGAAFPGLSIPPSEDAHDIVIHPGSGSRRKNWPFAHFAELARRLEGLGRSVTWCLGPAEREGAAAAPWKGIAGQDILETSSLVDLASALANSSHFIGNDGGITHLAAAVGCPALALFGPTDPQVWAPRGACVRVLHGDPWPDIDTAFSAMT